ncbi:MAG: class I SAM-dependent methyltransferase [Verrucomicrobia bacterium]|nr:class I SAM-dependent methyltransferase [Verrucomicrobiota bacterium]
MKKGALEEVYRTHHERGGRYGYLFCHGERGPYLREWIGAGKRVLDLGCRDGMLTRSFFEGNEIVGVDIDRKALEIARRDLEIETIWLDLNAEWPFPPESFDAVVACEIAEHIFFLEPFLANICASLKPGGVFVGSVPNAFRMRNRMKFLFGKEFETDPTHVRMFSQSKLEKVLGDLFIEAEIIPIQGKIAPFIPVSPKVPQWLNRLFAKDLLWRAKKRSEHL